MAKSITPYSFSNFSNLINRYDSFILDIWGVIHDGFQAYPGAIDCVNTLIAQHKNIVFLSNAPRPGAVLMKKLREFGIPEQGTAIVSSGDAVRTALERFDDPIFHRLEKRCYHLGAARNQDILSGMSLETTDNIEEASFILLTAYSDEGEELSQYDSILGKAFHLGLPVICANPDTEIMNGEKLRYCAGVFADKYKKMGGKVHYYGKPHEVVYTAVFEKLPHAGFNKQRILMVGDTLETDVLGAKKAGIHCALTRTGNVALYLAKNKSRGLSEEELLHELFEAEKLEPDWIIPGFFC